MPLLFIHSIYMRTLRLIDRTADYLERSIPTHGLNSHGHVTVSLAGLFAP